MSGNEIAAYIFGALAALAFVMSFIVRGYEKDCAASGGSSRGFYCDHK